MTSAAELKWWIYSQPDGFELNTNEATKSDEKNVGDHVVCAN